MKLAREASATNLKRNRSHHDVARRNKSFDRLRALTSANKPRTGKRYTAVNQPRVQFELGIGRDDEDEDGDDDNEVDDDEWVDDNTGGASTPNVNTPRDQPSPRPPKSPLAPATAAARNRDSTGGTSTEPADPAMSSADREIALHKEYLTSRLLKRAPSHGAPPQISSAIASVPLSQSQSSPPGTMSQDSTAPATPLTNTTVVNTPANDDGLTSRFITRPGSHLHREGSFYTHEPAPDTTRSLEAKAPRRPRSMANLTTASSSKTEPSSSAENSDDMRQRSRRRRPAAPPAETSRTQQKLNLQRASSVIEPGQPLSAAAVGGQGMGMGLGMPLGMGMPGANSLVNIPGAAFDGGSSRDPRVGRLLERTGMEYRVVRRYQNPLVRSLNRLAHIQGADRPRQIPSRGGANGLATPGVAATPPVGGLSHARHARTASNLPPVPRNTDPSRRPVTPSRPQSARAMSSTTGFDVDEAGAIADRLSGVSLVEQEDDRVAIALRNLWDKPLDLSASQ